MPLERESSPAKHFALPDFARELLTPAAEISDPTLLLLNTRLFVHGLGEGKTIKDTPKATLDEWANNFQYVWFMGIYPPSTISLVDAQNYINRDFPHLSHLGVVPSPFAIPTYDQPSPQIASGWPEWDNLRSSLDRRGVRTIVDFAPHHVALDHPWTEERPDFFIRISQEQFDSLPSDKKSWFVKSDKGDWIAHGRDPSFGPYGDTLQTNLANPDCRRALIGESQALSDHAAGARVDMVQLAEHYREIWGEFLTDEETAFLRENPHFIAEFRREMGPEFMLIGEDYEGIDQRDKLKETFDYVYDKGLYDLAKGVLREGFEAQNLRSALATLAQIKAANPTGSQNLVFTENHDEDRAVTAFGGKSQSQAAACLLGLIPGTMYMMHDGQDIGRTLKLPLQIGKYPPEEADLNLKDFYQRLLGFRNSALFQEGIHSYPSTFPSHQINGSFKDIIAHRIEKDGMGTIICTNTKGHDSDCHINLPPDAEIHVQNFYTGEMLADEEIAKVNADGTFYVKLSPYSTQLVWYNIQGIQG